MGLPVLDLLGWLALAIAALIASRGWRPTRADLRVAATLLVSGLALRLLVPKVPLNWYLGLVDSPFAIDRGPVFTRPTARLPLPERLVGIDLGLGFAGMVGWNVLVGTAVPVVLWLASRRAGRPEREARLIGLLAATVPLYVRVSSSDACAETALLLWSVAALALSGDGERRPAECAVVGVATVLGCVIRPESALVFAALPFFVAPTWSRLRALVSDTRARDVFLGAFCAGLAAAALTFSEVLDQRVVAHRFLDAPALVIGVVLHALFLFNPLPDYLVPPPLVLAAWCWLARAVRQRDRDAWLTMTPIVLLAIPFASAGGAFFTALPDGAYHLVYLVLALPPIASGIVQLYDWTRARSPGMRRASTLVALALLVASVIPAYRVTYAYQEELRFLNEVLPRGPATIVTICDPEQGNGDLDSSLALPYPTLLVDRPELRWVVLTRADLARPLPEPFDLYYPGSMTTLARGGVDAWLPMRLARRFLPSMRPEIDRRSAEQDRHLAAIDALDQRVRATFPLTTLATREVPAHTFSSGRFLDERTTLTLFALRRADR